MGHGDDDWFLGATAGSETGALARAVDWAATSLGPPASWPDGLRLPVELCFSSRFPILVVWGTELVKIYNDGYRELLGSEKHPDAMGAPARDVWPEIWDVIGPMFDGVLRTGRPTWEVDQLLLIARSGFPEECYFTYSYSPLRDDDGRIAGVLNIVTETTSLVVGNRRLVCLGDLGVALAGASDAPHLEEVCRRAVTVLGAHAADLCAVGIHIDVGGELVLAGSTAEGTPRIDPALLRRVVEHSVAEVVDDGHRRDVAAGSTGATVALPLGRGAGDPIGVLTVATSGRRPLDAAYRSFLDLVAAEISEALAAAARRTSELAGLRRTSDALQRALLPEVADAAGIAVRYLPALDDLAVGGDWYDVVDLGDGRTALAVGDSVGKGLQAAATMGQLRSATRALLLEDNGPAAILTGLDRFAESVDGARCSTVLCGIVDRDARTFTYAAAGHPAPLVLRDGEAHWLEGGRSTPLATGGGRRDEAVAQLLETDTIVLYTDGLVERRGESLTNGFGRLADAATALAGSPVEVLADGILDRLIGGVIGGGARDDIALLVHRSAG